jgi:hypothetical protein
MPTTTSFDGRVSIVDGDGSQRLLINKNCSGMIRHHRTDALPFKYLPESESNAIKRYDLENNHSVLKLSAGDDAQYIMNANHGMATLTAGNHANISIKNNHGSLTIKAGDGLHFDLQSQHGHIKIEAGHGSVVSIKDNHGVVSLKHDLQTTLLKNHGVISYYGSGEIRVGEKCIEKIEGTIRVGKLVGPAATPKAHANMCGGETTQQASEGVGPSSGSEVHPAPDDPPPYSYPPPAYSYASSLSSIAASSLTSVDSSNLTIRAPSTRTSIDTTSLVSFDMSGEQDVEGLDVDLRSLKLHQAT